VILDWQANAALSVHQARAQLWAQVRDFFSARGVLEVETPILAQAAAPEPSITPFVTTYDGPGGGRTLYLQSSPELHMKRLLATGSGPIFQIFRAFRNGESGRWHNPEFSLLEWYRPGFSSTDLIAESDALVQHVLATPPARSISYTQVFLDYTGLHPLRASLSDLRAHAAQAGLLEENMDRDGYLNFLFSTLIEPHLGHDAPLFVYNFPASQAALARLHPHCPEYAERFELYVQGLELANGFHELTDVTEQRARFRRECAARAAQGGLAIPLDQRFLAALEAGLPDCAGIALGLDRLLMLKIQATHIDEVLAFPFARA
jgi:elongation factor P--(R)-beta-lysine ligase